MTHPKTNSAFEAAVIPQERDGQTMIDARELHAWLGIRDPFHQWMRRRVDEWGFEEGTDFCTSLVRTRGRPRTDYLLTLDTAKELSMVERTEKGRMTRRYFIEMERAAHQMAATLVEQGRTAAIPDSFFDAKAEIMGLREELVRMLDERLPAAKRLALPKPWMTSREIIQALKLDIGAPQLGWDLTVLTGEMGLKVRQQKRGNLNVNLYPSEVVEAYAARAA